ncbi:MAG TPA: CaiB/BaiF CoA-transferase family protein [Candidatus Acidoferrum sp.]|nr:CaiB/BaiF CoA-transferase family protein [Candidatus Acidoferrum sp.]
MAGPLAGVRVLDLTRVLAGPFTTMLLADLGAEVVKLEEPGVGDETRPIGPFLNGVSTYFISINRGKKGLTLNLKSEAGRRLFLDLVGQADVLVENYRPGVMKRLGVDYPALHNKHPQLVYAACSGFGQTGPYAERAAYDMIVQGMGGIMSITGEMGGSPVRVGVSIGDLGAALFTTVGILAAICHARATGEGQLVDVGMLDCQVALLENAIMRNLVTGEIPRPLGSRHPSIAPFEAFPAADGQVILAVGTKQWARFCQAIGRPDLIQHPDFSTNALRADHVDALRDILAPIFQQKSVAVWIQEMETIGIPCGPVNTVDKTVKDPHVLAREMIVSAVDPEAGPVSMAGLPIKLSATPCAIQGPAPRLGEHTESVLAEWLHLQPGAVARLREEGVV